MLQQRRFELVFILAIVERHNSMMQMTNTFYVEGQKDNYVSIPLSLSDIEIALNDHSNLVETPISYSTPDRIQKMKSN